MWVIYNKPKSPQAIFLFRILWSIIFCSPKSTTLFSFQVSIQQFVENYNKILGLTSDVWCKINLVLNSVHLLKGGRGEKLKNKNMWCKINLVLNRVMQILPDTHNFSISILIISNRYHIYPCSSNFNKLTLTLDLGKGSKDINQRFYQHLNLMVNLISLES